MSSCSVAVPIPLRLIAFLPSLNMEQIQSRHFRWAAILSIRPLPVNRSWSFLHAHRTAIDHDRHAPWPSAGAVIGFGAIWSCLNESFKLHEVSYRASHKKMNTYEYIQTKQCHWCFSSTCTRCGSAWLFTNFFIAAWLDCWQWNITCRPTFKAGSLERILSFACHIS